MICWIVTRKSILQKDKKILMPISTYLKTIKDNKNSLVIIHQTLKDVEHIS